MLLEHPGEVVLRSEIRQRLWPGDTAVEFDQSINAAVRRLRSALSESADAPRYIETVAKRGYRFIAEVQRNGEAPAEPAAPVASRYRLLERLGEDGAGAVYRAEDRTLGRYVAVKFLPVPEGALPDSAPPRPELDARAAWSLNHPHIRTVYGLEDVDGRPGIVMELLGGETLAARLTRGPVPLRDALRIALETARALGEAHAAGIVYGDLKPANIRLTKNGVKVLDFGLATREDAPQASPGAALKYLSPEQRQGESGDARSDIFSLGLVLYEMLSGTLAPEGASAEDLSDVPPSVTPFLTRCLARNPHARWQSATEAQMDLERLQEQLVPVAVLAPRRIWPRLLAAASVALAFATGWYLQLGRGSQGPPSRAVPLTTLTGQQNFPAFSPDGEKVAFSWVGPPRQDGQPAMNIYAKSILTGEVVAVTTGPTDDRFPAWSPGRPRDRIPADHAGNSRPDDRPFGRWHGAEDRGRGRGRGFLLVARRKRDCLCPSLRPRRQWRHFSAVAQDRGSSTNHRSAAPSGAYGGMVTGR
jgi:hypothetical protein